MKKILVLGAGIGQKSLLKKCKDRGYYIIVASIKGDYPGLIYADEVHDIDIRDKIKLTELAKKQRVQAICSEQNDIAVPSIAYVAKKLGLKGISIELANNCSDKYLMRIIRKL